MKENNQSFFYLLFHYMYLFCVLCVCAHACVCHNMHLQVRGQFTRVDSFLPLCNSLEIKIGWSGLWQTPLPTEPFNCPTGVYCIGRRKGEKGKEKSKPRIYRASR